MFYRSLLALACLMTVSFSMVMIFINAQTGNFDYLSDLIPPDDCPAPCWMDVRAGEMPGEAAVALLKNHMWVEDVTFFQPIDDINTRYFGWRWNGRQPAWIDATWRGEMRVYKTTVAGLKVHTHLTLGEIWLSLGGTNRGILIPASDNPDRDVTHIVVFPAQSLLVRATMSRRVSLREYWFSPVEIESAGRLAVEYYQTYDYPHPCSKMACLG